jgi:hypothetical protein
MPCEFPDGDIWTDEDEPVGNAEDAWKKAYQQARDAAEQAKNVVFEEHPGAESE